MIIGSLVGLGGGAPNQDALNVGEQGLGPLPALFVGQTGEGMLGNDVLEVGHAHHAGHGFGRVIEYVGDDRSRWQTQALHLDSVVHTARTAGASITDPGDENVHLVQHVLDHIGLGGQGCRMLVEEDDVFQIVLLIQHLAQFV